MRIAQVAPIMEAVPPRLYGGTERVVHWLTEGLVARGHDVTLFATADSKTSARLIPCAPAGLRLSGVKDMAPWMTGLVREVMRQARSGAFEMIHAHIDHWGFPLSSFQDVPVVHTMHGRMDDPDYRPLYARAAECLLISISDNQRTPVPGAAWVATIHHGMPRALLSFGERSADPPFVLFLGRISREKLPHLAIDVARLAGIPLKIAAKLDGKPDDRAYFEAEVAPRLAHGDGVDFIGEVDDRRKAELLGAARALLFPVDWPEPFGLVAIEALACGTPVVTRPFGALPELIEDGRTGFLASGIDDLVSGLKRTGDLDRAACRATFERRFAVELMVERYESIYRDVIARGRDGASWGAAA